MSGLWGGGLFIITLAVQEATRRSAGPWLASCGCRRTVVQSPCLETHTKKEMFKRSVYLYNISRCFIFQLLTSKNIIHDADGVQVASVLPFAIIVSLVLK